MYKPGLEMYFCNLLIVIIILVQSDCQWVGFTTKDCQKVRKYFILSLKYLNTFTFVIKTIT